MTRCPARGCCTCARRGTQGLFKGCVCHARCRGLLQAQHYAASAAAAPPVHASTRAHALWQAGSPAASQASLLLVAAEVVGAAGAGARSARGAAVVRRRLEHNVCVTGKCRLYEVRMKEEGRGRKCQGAPVFPQGLAPCGPYPGACPAWRRPLAPWRLHACQPALHVRAGRPLTHGAAGRGQAAEAAALVVKVAILLYGCGGAACTLPNSVGQGWRRSAAVE